MSSPRWCVRAFLTAVLVAGSRTMPTIRPRTLAVETVRDCPQMITPAFVWPASPAVIGTSPGYRDVCLAALIGQTVMSPERWKGS